MFFEFFLPSLKHQKNCLVLSFSELRPDRLSFCPHNISFVHNCFALFHRFGHWIGRMVACLRPYANVFNSVFQYILLSFKILLLQVQLENIEELLRLYLEVLLLLLYLGI